MGIFNKHTVKDIDLAGERVLLRTDYNVPVDNGRITDDFRMKQSLPTIDYILGQKPERLVIISHLGRPTNAFDKSCSLKPVANHLAKLSGRKVIFVPDCIGDEVRQAVDDAEKGSILMLENLRFHPEEEKNEHDFAKKIVDAVGAEIFVQDGFGVVHRAHASTSAITNLLPSVAGLLLEKEVETITQVMKNPERPLVAVVGGAKIEDKIEVLKCLIELADCVAIGGAMANNFLKAEGIYIGKSICEKGDLGTAKTALSKARSKERKQAFSFLLPVDGVVSTSIDGRASTRVVDLTSFCLADIEAYPKTPKPKTYEVGKDEAIYDIGPVSAGRITGAISMARTVIWNGTLGVTETKGIAGAHPPFSHGTRMVAGAIIGSSNTQPKPFSLVGGGDTVGYIEDEGLTEDFNHVSTGGGASLELMAGKKLPGVEALMDKD